MVADTWVVITGGAGGIGRASAAAFLDQGANVLLIDVSESRLAAAAAALGAAGRVATCCSTIETPAACAAAFAQAGGPVHALVHLAGVFEKDNLDPADHGVWDRAIAHNLTNAYDMAVAAMAGATPPAAIVLVSSIAFRRGSVDRAAYSAAKGGIVGLTRALSRQLAPAVRVNAVAPGIIETAMTDEIIASRGPAYLDAIPLRRYGKAAEVASVIRFLCSEDASYVTGQTITIDGGMTNA